MAREREILDLHRPHADGNDVYVVHSDHLHCRAIERECLFQNRQHLIRDQNAAHALITIFHGQNIFDIRCGVDAVLRASPALVMQAEESARIAVGRLVAIFDFQRLCGPAGAGCGGVVDFPNVPHSAALAGSYGEGSIEAIQSNQITAILCHVDDQSIVHFRYPCFLRHKGRGEHRGGCGDREAEEE